MRWSIITVLSLVAMPIIAEPIQRVYRSAYFLGRGDTGISIADDHEAIFYNPAGIAEGKGIYKKTVVMSPMVEVSQSTRDLARELGVEEGEIGSDTFRKYLGRPQHLGFYNFTGIVLRRAAIGVFSSSTTDLLIANSEDDAGLPMAKASLAATQGVTFTVAESLFNKRLHLGATGKFVQHGTGAIKASVTDGDELKNIDSTDLLGLGTGTGGDFGMQYRHPGRSNFAAGLTIMNIGDTNLVPADVSKAPDPIYQTINLGLSIGPGTKLSKFRFLLDVRDLANRVQANVFRKLHLGAELTLIDMIGFTGGLNQGYATGGFYLDLYFARLDLGAYGEEVGERAGSRGDIRYFFRLSAGF